MKNKTSPSNLGAVISVLGSLIDIRFDAVLEPMKKSVLDMKAFLDKAKKAGNGNDICREQFGSAA